jgi:hypothetical protein
MKKEVNYNCKKHEDCKKVKGHGSPLEFVHCPYCNYLVSTNNPCNWCSGCYRLFKIENEFIHFSNKFSKTDAQIWAIAISKSGGIKIGNIK